MKKKRTVLTIVAAVFAAAAAMPLLLNVCSIRNGRGERFDGTSGSFARQAMTIEND
jgi:hypothetical protein